MAYNILNEEGLSKLKQDQPDRFQHEIKGGQYLKLQNLELENLDGIDVDKFNKAAQIMRGLMFCALESVHSGHPGGSSSKTEMFLAQVLGGAMAFDALDPKNTGRDRVVWSAGHCSPGLYGGLALLYESLRLSGKEFDAEKIKAVMPEDLVNFRSLNGPQGHIEGYSPLSDVTTGASGHGLSAAAGMAITHKSSGLDTKVFVFMGDAETEEGMTYEARNILQTIGADNMIVSLDYNHFGIDGKIEEVINSPYINHWLGLGWNVIEVDGHNILELVYAYRKAAQGFGNNNPTVVLAHCIKGKYYGAKENSNTSHGSPAKSEEYVEIMKNLGFDIPGVAGDVQSDINFVLSHLSEDLREYIVERLEVAKNNIRPEAELVEKMKTAIPDRPFVNPMEIKRPEVLPDELVFPAGQDVPTRKATEAFFTWLMKQTAFFWTGTGDLSCSILTFKAEEVYGIINRANKYGRGIRFGIAEQNMAMLSTALTADRLPGGFAPVSAFSSYGVFTSMMSNSVRMSLINNHVNPDMKGFFVMLAAHDGPETGEDGPTHQGMYWMSLFNAYPGIKVYKPMDANETIEMLFYALEKGEPIALSVGRPNVPVLDRSNGVAPAREANNGAYIYKDYSNNDKEKKVLAICGSLTLKNTLEALPDLEEKFDVKIVAVTSLELFEELLLTNPEKAKAIFSDEDRAITTTLHNGWKGFLHPFMLPADYEKRTISIDNYLKSGSPDEVYGLAGMDAGGIKEKILKIKN
ncbi:MAG: thiamine pyrophosphate-dependent enzyme [Candidatus Magasanikbacteria bacterium]